MVTDEEEQALSGRCVGDRWAWTIVSTGRKWWVLMAGGVEAPVSTLGLMSWEVCHLLGTQPWGIWRVCWGSSGPWASTACCPSTWAPMTLWGVTLNSSRVLTEDEGLGGPSSTLLNPSSEREGLGQEHMHPAGQAAGVNLSLAFMTSLTFSEKWALLSRKEKVEQEYLCQQVC